jgi:ubiquinone/menaquinone biosynthesis C-methylase UbiE
MTTTQTLTTPDLVAVKAKQQQTWASGDFHVIAALIQPTAERLVDSADLHAGMRVLDVATGSGNAAIAAARLGCVVEGVDYVPALLERGRVRAAAEGYDIRLVEGDAEALPYADGEFDAVTTIFGSMFAPDHHRAAAELVRVTRPGGTIAVASWTPEGFIGQLLKTVGRHVPPPAGVSSPILWGTESHLREIFGGGISSLSVAERTFTWRFRSMQELVDTFRTWYGPTVKAFAALGEKGPDAQAALEADLVALVSRSDRLGTGQAVAVPATYLEAVAVRR